MNIYTIKNGAVVAMDGEFYANELEAYKALVATLKGEAKDKKATEADEEKPAVWKQPFRHACKLHFAGASSLRFPTLRKAFEWAVRGRGLTPFEEKAYRHATHCYEGGCKGAIRAQFFALRNIIDVCREETRLVKLERMGRDGNTYIYTVEVAK